MIPQVCGLIERGSANVASIGLLAGVNATMIPQCRVPGERLLAHLALIRTLARVYSLVILEMRTLRKLHAAGGALEGLLAGVHPAVIFQVCGCLQVFFSENFVISSCIYIHTGINITF